MFPLYPPKRCRYLLVFRISVSTWHANKVFWNRIENTLLLFPIPDLHSLSGRCRPGLLLFCILYQFISIHHSPIKVAYSLAYCTASSCPLDLFCLKVYAFAASLPRRGLLL
ncbi:unnamed protein product [Protopolystoma xenopodis]|uniref:Uncharacterized protein n=1 Tax=Protopolystoma xenopodis TaxID=117903 RepID=A0A3S5AG56_9PLAT|nr:unnamed protein product [Protopolystoma xenopodis]